MLSASLNETFPPFVLQRGSTERVRAQYGRVVREAAGGGRRGLHPVRRARAGDDDQHCGLHRLPGAHLPTLSVQQAHRPQHHQPHQTAGVQGTQGEHNVQQYL